MFWKLTIFYFTSQLNSLFAFCISMYIIYDTHICMCTDNVLQISVLHADRCKIYKKGAPNCMI